jgi:cobalt-zinc-cadmium efflux system outer membrane protein
MGFKNEKAASEEPAPPPGTDWLLRYGFGIELPVFNRNQGARQEAAALLEETKLDAKLAEETVKRDVRLALKRLQLSEDALDGVRRNLVPHAEAAARMAKTGYDLGELSLQQLIIEQQRLIEARTTLIDAGLEARRTRIDLARAVGD